MQCTIPPPLGQGHVLPTLRTRALLHLHVENSFLVPVLPAVPDRQGVVAPLQVKVLKGQLDHLGRDHGVREQAGAAGRHSYSCEEFPP